MLLGYFQFQRTDEIGKKSRTIKRSSTRFIQSSQSRKHYAECSSNDRLSQNQSTQANAQPKLKNHIETQSNIDSFAVYILFKPDSVQSIAATIHGSELHSILLYLAILKLVYVDNYCSIALMLILVLYTFNKVLNKIKHFRKLFGKNVTI